MCLSLRTRILNGRRIVHPCGYCSECVRRKKLDWELRLYHASQWADCSFFKLLTYDDVHYPLDDFDKDIQRDHIQRFIKRLRITLKRKFGDVTLKYFIASEHGELKNRLHYHCLFFLKGLPGTPVKFTWAEFNEICKSVWPYGIVGNCYRVSSKRIRYCCKYIQKQYNYKWFSQFELYKIAPALPWLVRRNTRLRDPDYLPRVAYNGRLVSLPYYWKKIIFSAPERVVLRVTFQRYCDRQPYNRKQMDRRLRKNANFWNKEGVDMYVPEFCYPDNSDLVTFKL